MSRPGRQPAAGAVGVIYRVHLLCKPEEVRVSGLRQVQRCSRTLKTWCMRLLTPVLPPFVVGGLNYQIEHHLFPTLPRHNLAKVRAAVEELCRKHGLAYESCGMAAGTVKVLKHLADIASQA